MFNGLWRGIGPNVARNAIVNASELATYDQVLYAHNQSLNTPASAAQPSFHRAFNMCVSLLGTTSACISRLAMAIAELTHFNLLLHLLPCPQGVSTHDKAIHYP